jgi:DNA-binding CsgD family transcriptional regulator
MQGCDRAGRDPIVLADLSPDAAWTLLKWLVEDNRWRDIGEAVWRFGQGDLDGAGGRLDRLRRSGALCQLANIVLDDLLLEPEGRDVLIERLTAEQKEGITRGSGGYQSNNLAVRRFRRPRLELSMKQRLVLGYVRDGLSNKQIGARLNVSLNTVKWHLKNMSVLLGATNRVNMIKIATAKNLLG